MKNNENMRKTEKKTVTYNAIYGIILLMENIRQKTLKRMSELGLTIYQVAKLVKGTIPQRTVYNYLTGQQDTTTETASMLLAVLGLTIEPVPEFKETLRMSKPTSFRGRIIDEWKQAGKPQWCSRELLAMCLLIDFEFKREGANPAPVFRGYVESNNYAMSMTWAQGLKFKNWK